MGAYQENLMQLVPGVAIGAALSLALLGGCSKPADTAADTAAATSDAAAPGGVVSAPPSPQNDAVNTDANTTETIPSEGSNSFTEGQARGHIENAGYADVTGLTKTADGMWTGRATKAGKTTDVSVDFKGAVTAK